MRKHMFAKSPVLFGFVFLPAAIVPGERELGNVCPRLLSIPPSVSALGSNAIGT